MRFSAGTKSAASLLWLLVAGCSGSPPVRDTSGPVRGAAGSGSQPPTTSANTSGTGAPVIDGADNANPLPIITTAGTSGDQPVAGDGCEIGKFCKPVMADSDCGKIDLKTTVKVIKKPGRILVVYDRSTSMEEAWNGMPKFTAAGNAVVAALTPLKDLLTVGAEFFPSQNAMAMSMCPTGCNPADALHWIPGPGACCLNAVGGDSCFISPISAPDQIAFGPADKFLAAAPMLWRFPMGAIGQTPLEGGVAEGAKALTAHKFDGATNVIIITDGEPNCMTNTANVLTQVKTWQMAGINTHVVGLPGAQGAADLLNMIAQAGGTGMYIDPKDPKELETRLSAVLMSTVRQGFDSCTFHLDPKADAPDKLHLIVTQNGKDADVKRDLSKDAHWSINPAGDQVDLEGQLCDLAKDGTFEGLRFVFGCVDVPPLEPPPPPVLN